MNNHKDILLKLLEAIGYKDNREAFVSEFERNIRLQSISDLIKALPSKQQEGLKRELNHNLGNPEKALEILKNEFSDSQIQDALEQTANDSITKYVQAISSTMTNSQREALVKILEESGKSSLTSNLPR